MKNPKPAAPMSPLVQIALQYHRAGQLQQAEEMYRKMPHNPDALHLLGVIHLQSGRQASAVELINKAIRINGSDAMYHCNAGLAYQALNKFREAEACCKKALSLKPDFVDAFNVMGLALDSQGRLDHAVINFNKALTLKPDHADAWNNLGNTLKRQGKLDEAAACYRKALALTPGSYRVHSNLLSTLQSSADRPPSDTFMEHLRFAEVFEAPLKKIWQSHLNTREPGKRLKVGYVSADFRRHPVAYFIEPVLASHDKTQVEIFCYYNDIAQDNLTDKIQSHADHWIACARMSDEQLAERIRSDGIDVLVDLSGHTANNRLLTFARKPAPVQLTYLGYPGTSGLSSIDYRITDAYSDPQDSEQYYVEKLLRMPDSLCCYRATPDMPEVTPLPALKNGFLTFGSFNNINKIDQQSIELWAELLRTLPTSRLVMVTVPEGERRQWLTQQFSALGVAPERLDFHGFLPVREFHRLFQQVDISLDPLLFTGGTTTCESLWMGVPVIVLIGQRFVNRVGYSFLSAANMPEYAAATPQDYIRVAVKLADQLPQLAQVRARMREQLATSPLMDQARFTRNLEKIYRDIWTTWCNGAS
jgi:protein O-GlcNAc transferase